MTINTLTRNAGSVATNVSIVERSVTKLLIVKKQKEGLREKKITYQGRVFALTDEEAQETPTVVIGTLLVNGNSTKVLFDSGTTHSFICNIFAKSLGCHYLKTVDDEFWVRTLWVLMLE